MTSGQSTVTSSVVITSNPSSSLRAEGRNIPYSTEIRWCDQGFFHKSGCVARKRYRWFLDLWREQEFVRFVEMFLKIHFIERTPLQRDTCGPGRNWQTFEQLPDQTMYGPKYGPTIGKAVQKREKQEWANEKQKLDNAQRTRGIYFTVSEDEEYKEVHPAHRELERG